MIVVVVGIEFINYVQEYKEHEMSDLQYPLFRFSLDGSYSLEEEVSSLLRESITVES